MLVCMSNRVDIAGILNIGLTDVEEVMMYFSGCCGQYEDLKCLRDERRGRAAKFHAQKLACKRSSVCKDKRDVTCHHRFNHAARCLRCVHNCLDCCHVLFLTQSGPKKKKRTN